MARAIGLFIRLFDGSRAFRFWLDPDALERGRVVAPDGTGEQCSGCGEDLSTADVTANAHATKVKCANAACGATYLVHEAS